MLIEIPIPLPITLPDQPEHRFSERHANTTTSTASLPPQRHLILPGQLTLIYTMPNFYVIHLMALRLPS